MTLQLILGRSAVSINFADFYSELVFAITKPQCEEIKTTSYLQLPKHRSVLESSVSLPPSFFVLCLCFVSSLKPSVYTIGI